MTLSCASGSSLDPSSIPLESRKYDILENCSGFSWQYRVCTKKFLGFCTKREIRAEIIQAEFKDKVECKKLYDMNFILQIREKPL